MNKSPVQVRDVVLPNDVNDIRRLWFEYLIWGNDEMQSLYGVHPHNPQEAVEQDIELIDKFLPPYGRLMLAVHEGKVCGLGSLKSINKEIGEIKRMYVDPRFRRIGADELYLKVCF